MKKMTIFMIFFLISHASFAVNNAIESIQKCTPGSYTLPLPQGFLAIGNANQINYQIIGMNSGKCQMTITGSYIKSGETAAKQFTLACAFSPSDLSQLSQSMQNISFESLTLANVINSPIVSLLKASCQKK
jgi:hypothetical protein